MAKMIGVSDEVTVCEKCGKANLKRTVVLSTDDGVVYYGTECAAKSMGRKSAEINVEADVMDYTRRALAVHTPAVVAQKVWNKFGFSTMARDGGVVVNGIGFIGA